MRRQQIPISIVFTMLVSIAFFFSSVNAKTFSSSLQNPKKVSKTSKFVKTSKKPIRKVAGTRKKIRRANHVSHEESPIVSLLEEVKIHHIPSKKLMQFHFAGDVVLLYFWGKKDGTFEERHKILNSLQVQYAKKDLKVLSINLEGIPYIEKNIDLKDWGKKFPALGFTLFTTKSPIYREVGKKYPLLLLNQNGIIFYKGSFKDKTSIKSYLDNYLK